MMKRLAWTAVVVAMLIQPAATEFDEDLYRLRSDLCMSYADTNLEKALECHLELRRDAQRELDKLKVRLARNEVTSAFLARHGIKEPDLIAKSEVAFRQRILFAVILNECHAATSTVADYETCLDQREKAEVWLGNTMSEPQ